MTTSPSRDVLRPLVWGAMLIASQLPIILFRLSTGADAAPAWLIWARVAVLGLLLALTFVLPRVRDLRGYLLALIAFLVGWEVITPAILHHPAVERYSEEASIGARILLTRTVPVVGVALMALTLWGSGITRRDLFLVRGDVSAPARATPLLGIREGSSWMQVGMTFLLILSSVLALFFALTLRPSLTALPTLLLALPGILLASAINSANEEFQFRSIFFARLIPVLGAQETLWLTAVLFGLGHFYGQPSGAVGVLLTGFAGWFWGKSMLETRGFFWAWFIHMVQDVIILSFLVLAVTSRA
ncbi:MAG: CPBP family intramembrane metalloprotease [Ardenticatenales bacterium]|nr:CPBP family intramembrane metalloprotease [Ardenticatenales bacterium]